MAEIYKKLNLRLGALCLSLMLIASASAEEPSYVLNTSTGAPYTTKERTGFQDLIVAEVFRRLGLKGQVEKYSASARALINANEDIDQGVVMRIKGLEKKFPNLIRVDERLIENDFVAYSKDLNFSTSSWDSLKSHSVAYVHGWVIFESNLAQDQIKYDVKDPAQMFAMLDKGRTDLILYERWQGLQWAKQSNLKIIAHEPPLASVNMYMYMHKNHAELVPKMAEALREMKADGTYKAIFDRTLANLLPAN